MSVEKTKAAKEATAVPATGEFGLEKLALLGTMTSGLMHELRNPGAAAGHAAARLRSNLLRLEQTTLRMSEEPKTQQQRECMHSLLERMLRSNAPAALGSLEQAKAEKEMTLWLAELGVENPETIAPVLVDAGLAPDGLRCTAQSFSAADFSDTLNWLEALVTSSALVSAIEESVARVAGLAEAVTAYAAEGRAESGALDVHENLRNTLKILDHKIRAKQIRVAKNFQAQPATVDARGVSLGQVWTNLIDNAASASPVGGEIEIATWIEPEWLVVSITDHGPGIPPEVRPHIFEAFFTTKPQGEGTGLGLEIVHKIVTRKYRGRIEVESEPGKTCFVVRLPRPPAEL